VVEPPSGLDETTSAAFKEASVKKVNIDKSQ
jgi:hypothetical protein